MKSANNSPVCFRGFTLVELLVVVAIIALLLGLLIPSLTKARHVARQVACLANMNAVGKGCWMYATTNNDYFPDRYATGGFGFRQAPGNTTKGDARSLPETFGLAAVLGNEKCLDGNSKAWVCPASSSRYKEYGNSYAFTVARMLSKKKVSQLKRITNHWMLWDNYILQPGLTGFRGPFRGYTLPRDEREYFHKDILPASLKDKQYLSSNVLFYDCHAESRLQK